jgi:hypothetical protein
MPTPTSGRLVGAWTSNDSELHLLQCTSDGCSCGVAHDADAPILGADPFLGVAGDEVTLGFTRIGSAPPSIAAAIAHLDSGIFPQP